MPEPKPLDLDDIERRARGIARLLPEEEFYVSPAEVLALVEQVRYWRDAFRLERERAMAAEQALSESCQARLLEQQLHRSGDVQ